MIFYGSKNKKICNILKNIFARKYKRRLLDTGLDPLKTASKKVVHKTDEFLGNKIANAVTRSKDNQIVK